MVCNKRAIRFCVGIRRDSKLMNLTVRLPLFAGLLWGLVLNGGVICGQTKNPENAGLSNSERRQQLGDLRSQLSEAMFKKDQQKIQTIVEESVSILGDRAGLPEAADDYGTHHHQLPLSSTQGNRTCCSAGDSILRGTAMVESWKWIPRRKAMLFVKWPRSSKLAYSSVRCRRAPRTVADDRQRWGRLPVVGLSHRQKTGLFPFRRFVMAPDAPFRWLKRS